jgi:hypothetical protein
MCVISRPYASGRANALAIVDGAKDFRLKIGR